MPGIQGKPMTAKEIGRIKLLLATTDEPLGTIALRMGCSVSVIGAVNRRFDIRRYNGRRSGWQTGAGGEEFVLAGSERSPESLGNQVLDRPTILFVDDDEQIRRLMEVYFRLNRLKAVTAADGSDGLQKLLSNEAISIIVTDQEMPVMKGDRFVSESLKVNPNLKIVVAASSPDSFKFPGCGATFVEKPYAPNQLVEVIRSLMAQP